MQIEVPEPPMPFKTWLEIFDNIEAMFPREEITDDYQIVLTKRLDDKLRDMQRGRGIKPEQVDYVISYAQLKTYALGELLECRFSAEEAFLATDSIGMVPHLIHDTAETLFNIKEKINHLTIKQ